MNEFCHKINDIDVTVRLCRNKRAKRMILRFDSINNLLNLTAPPRISQKQIHGFLKNAEGWILKQASNASPSSPFENNSTIPVFGKEYKIVHQSSYERLDVKLDDEHLVVSGPAERLNMMVLLFLKRHSKTVLTKYCDQYAVALGMQVNKITIRDTKSRWGSCSSSGNISLCWRLLLAPNSVAQYVCAHEVAHLKEMNHSPRFWKVVEKLYPHYKESKQWLKKHGEGLFKYGVQNT